MRSRKTRSITFKKPFIRKVADTAAYISKTKYSPFPLPWIWMKGDIGRLKHIALRKARVFQSKREVFIERDRSHFAQVWNMVLLGNRDNLSPKRYYLYRHCFAQSLTTPRLFGTADVGGRLRKFTDSHNLTYADVFLKP